MGKLNFCQKCGSMQVEEAKAQLEELLEKKAMIVPTRCGLCDIIISVASEAENQIFIKVKQECNSEDESCETMDYETQLRTKKTKSPLVSKPPGTNVDVVHSHETTRCKMSLRQPRTTKTKSPLVSKPAGTNIDEVQSHETARCKMSLRTRKRPLHNSEETATSSNVKIGKGTTDKIDSPSTESGMKSKKAKIAVVSPSQRTRYPRNRRSIYSVPVDSSVGKERDYEMVEISLNHNEIIEDAEKNDVEGEDGNEDVLLHNDGDEDEELVDDDVEEDPNEDDDDDDDFCPSDDKDETVETEKTEKQARKKDRTKAGQLRGELIKSMLAPNVLALITDDSQRDDQSYAQCKLCGQNFYNMKTFTAHLAARHKKVEKVTHPYQCATCHQPFKLAASLRQHLDANHKEIATCTLCHKSSAVRNWLAKHMVTHQPKERKFECPECNIKFKSNKDLKRHMMIHTGERPYSCEFCEKTFLRPDDLKCHINLHKGIFFYCSFCPLKTHRERTLRQHIIRQHSGEKKSALRNHPCDHCDKSFFTNSALKRHLKSIHKIDIKGKKVDMEDDEEKSMRGFQGSIDKSLLHHEVLDMITEQSKKVDTNTAQCKFCELNFFTVKTLLKHLESKHDQQHIASPYQCQQCEEQFTLVAPLKIHIEKNHKYRDTEKKEKLVKSLLDPNILDLLTEHSRNNDSDTAQCKFCESDFSTITDFLHHMELEHDKQITKPYQCNECKKQFQNAAPLEKHIQVKHKDLKSTGGNILKSLLYPEYLDFLSDQSKQDDTDIAECKFCQQRFSTLTIFVNHMESEHDKKITEPYQCPCCQQRYDKSKPLRIHIQQKHKEVQTCKVCGKFSMQKNWLTKHMEIHSRNTNESLERDNKGRLKKFKCSELYCLYACARKRDMDRHILTHTGERPHICEQCGKGFRRIEELNQHLRFHRGEFFYCSLCPLKTTSVRTLRAHIKRQHTDAEKKPVVKNVICEICGHAFSNESVMRRHKMNTHIKSVMHYCKECDYKTHIAGSLSTHVKQVHLKIRNHKCLFCDATFFDKKGLMWHTRRHTGEKPHQCKYCGKLFKRPDGLRYHLRLHEAEYNYTCDICGFSTIRMQMLLRHKERKHSDTPRHVCTKCNMTFTSPQALIAHNRQHKDGVEFVTKKPHQCDQCDYSTDQPKLLRKHLERCHENDLNYECGYCHKKFHTEAQCKTHVRNFHEKYFLATFVDQRVASVSQEDIVEHVKSEPTAVVTETMDDLSAALAPILAATDEMQMDTPTTTTISITVNSDESVSLDSGTIRAASEEENAVAAAVLGLLPTRYGAEFPATSEVEETPIQVITEVTSEVLAEVPTQVISKVTSEVPTKVISEATSEVPAEVPTQVITEVTAEVPTQVITEMTSEVPTEVLSQEISEVATEVVSQVTSEVTTEVASQVTSEVTSALLTMDESSRVTVTEGD